MQIKKFEMYVENVASVQELRELIIKVRAIHPEAKVYIRCDIMEDVNTGDLIFLYGWNLVERYGYKNIMLADVDNHSCIAKQYQNAMFDVKVSV